MARETSLKILCNSLISVRQLVSYQQRPPPGRSDNIVFKLLLLTQEAGTLLRLPQEVIAASVILLQRYLVTASKQHDFEASITEIFGSSLKSELPLSSATSIFICAKQSFYPLSPRSIINVYALLAARDSSTIRLSAVEDEKSSSHESPQPNGTLYYVSEGTYQAQRELMFNKEREILGAVGFETRAALPYTLALTYLQALSASSPALSGRVLAHLNSALLSPQLLYLTHQPNALAVAAIYLAAREGNIALADDEVPWWDVFDVSREELGFLVLSLASVNGYVENAMS